MKCVLLCASLWVAIQTRYWERSVCPRISVPRISVPRISVRWVFLLIPCGWVFLIVQRPPGTSMEGSMSSTKSPIKRFVHKHQSWLTFAGAFIVFMTFAVKEGLGEHWRATADALNA